MSMGGESISSLKIYNNFKTWQQIVIFMLKHCDINFQTCEKPP